MMKQEFEEKIGCTITEEAYRVVEIVYMYHPVCDCIHAKERAAELWQIGGLAIFRDMLPRAKKCRDLESRIQTLEAEVQKLRDEWRDVKDGAIVAG